MKKKKSFYSVSDLAQQLSLPRTTINDWLKIYADYISFEVHGKRKLYPEATLELLKEISLLRSENRSSGEIEQILQQNHPIVAEVATPRHTDDGPETEPDNGSAVQLKPRVPAEKAALILSERLGKLSEQFDSFERTKQSQVRRAYTTIIAMILLFIIFSVALLYLGTLYLSDIEGQYRRREAERAKENELLRQELTFISEGTYKQAATIESIFSQIDARQFKYQQAIDELTASLAAQRALFEERLGEAASQADLIKARDEFAAERLKLLREIDFLQGKLNDLSHPVQDGGSTNIQ